jgi:hypothetical protein
VIFGLLILFRGTSLGIANFPGKECRSFDAWITSKTKTQPEIERILPPLENPNFLNSSDDGDVLLSGVAKDILGWAGLPSRMSFATFKSHSYNQLINSSKLQTGAFLIVIPGPKAVKLNRRKSGEPWITASPATLATSLPLKSLNILASALEFRHRSQFQTQLTTDTSGNINLNTIDTNRGLHQFHIEVAPSPYSFPLCRGRGGSCAIWEGSTGRIILDVAIAKRMIESSTVVQLLDRFTVAFATMITETSIDQSNISEDSNEENNKLSSVEIIGAFIAKTATATISSLLLSRRQSLWWCFACPIVLGLLAPFVINSGLTAAAEQLCAALQLPAAECSDLWWSAFALAMVLSLGSAVLIVYVCRLPDCIKRALDSN